MRNKKKNNISYQINIDFLLIYFVLKIKMFKNKCSRSIA